MAKYRKSVFAFALLVCILGAAIQPCRAAGAAPSTPASQQAIPPKVIDLTTVTCRDLLKASILDRSSAIMFLWGYVAGKKSITKFNTGQLEDATERLMSTCEAQPSMKIFSAITASAKTNEH